jgi:hypothetical protein
MAVVCYSLVPPSGQVWAGGEPFRHTTYFSHILWTKNHVLKKVGRTRAGDLFKFWYFLNLHALRYPKSVTKIFCAHFCVNKPLSMMWVVSTNAQFQKLLKELLDWAPARFLPQMLAKHLLNCEKIAVEPTNETIIWRQISYLSGQFSYHCTAVKFCLFKRQSRWHGPIWPVSR